MQGSTCGECHGPCIIEFYNPYGGCTVTSCNRSGRLHVMDDPESAGLSSFEQNQQK